MRRGASMSFRFISRVREGGGGRRGIDKVFGYSDGSWREKQTKHDTSLQTFHAQYQGQMQDSLSRRKLKLVISFLQPLSPSLLPRPPLYRQHIRPLTSNPSCLLTYRRLQDEGCGVTGARQRLQPAEEPAVADSPEADRQPGCEGPEHHHLGEGRDQHREPADPLCGGAPPRQEGVAGHL